MNLVVDDQFQRVEKALDQLVTSIANYNPKESLAAALVDADNQLSKTLDKGMDPKACRHDLTNVPVAVHQANHARLLALRRTSAELDGRIEAHIALLASTRAALLATPIASSAHKAARPLRYAELLSYARRISKFTRPPTFRADADAASTPAAASVEIKVDTPGAAAVAAGDRINADEAPGAVEAAASAAPTTTALPSVIAEWINPTDSGPGFAPWPLEETIQRGALASIQALLDQGIDPATVQEAGSGGVADADGLRESGDGPDSAAQTTGEQGGSGRVVRTRANDAAKPKVFTGLDLLDDD
jgi:hypothetical protein